MIENMLKHMKKSIKNVDHIIKMVLDILLLSLIIINKIHTKIKIAGKKCI